LGLDISILETFTLVADLGSFSAAARRMGITQPAVSLQIKSLERELAAPLIDRSHGKVLLTPAGRAAYEYAVKILADREKMMADIPRSTGVVAGRLLLGASNIPGEHLLPPMLSDFNCNYPDVSILLEIHDSLTVVARLRVEEIELGFVGALPEATMEFRRFASDRLVLIMPPRHPLSVKKKVSLAAISGERFISRTAGSGTRKRLAGALDELGLSEECLNVVAELGTNQAVVSAVQSGMGVSVISRLAAEQPARSGLMKMTEISGADVSRDFYVVYSPDRPLSVAAEKFLEMASGER
jgi:DNA-binding transcriptional LysR family regulator